MLIARVAYFFLFYVAWGLSLVGVVTGHPWIGPLLVAALALAHFASRQFAKSELLLSLILVVGGTLIDTLFLNSGLIDYRGGYTSLPWLAPLWVSSIWLLFSLTITTSFSWLAASLPLSTLFGAVGGPISYLAAVRIGAASFPYPFVAIALLALLWALLMPFILLLPGWLHKGECEK